MGPHLDGWMDGWIFSKWVFTPKTQEEKKIKEKKFKKPLDGCMDLEEQFFFKILIN